MQLKEETEERRRRDGGETEERRRREQKSVPRRSIELKSIFNGDSVRNDGHSGSEYFI